MNPIGTKQSERTFFWVNVFILIATCNIFFYHSGRTSANQRSHLDFQHENINEISDCISVSVHTVKRNLYIENKKLFTHSNLTETNLFENTKILVNNWNVEKWGSWIVIVWMNKWN